MGVWGKIILVLIFVIPITVCVITLQKLDEDYEEDEHTLQTGNPTSGDEILDNNEEDSGDLGELTIEMAGEKYVSTIGAPISKIYTDATVAITVANVYDEANENSEIVGTLEKFTVITAHKYPEGWTRISDGEISGWMRTENITFPEGGNLDVAGQPKTGKITAEPYLNMRAKASTSAEVITTIPKGTTVTIKESTNGWYKVTYASATGWISADYVKLDQ